MTTCACGRAQCQYAMLGIKPCPPLPGMADARRALRLPHIPADATVRHRYDGRVGFIIYPADHPGRNGADAVVRWSTGPERDQEIDEALLEEVKVQVDRLSEHDLDEIQREIEEDGYAGNSSIQRLLNEVRALKGEIAIASQLPAVRNAFALLRAQ